MNFRFEKILKHPVFLKTISEIKTAEENRFFCRHNIEHLIDVARISYIICLEKKLDISKDIIYATALLHDIGRYEEYKNNKPHDKIGAKIAEHILHDCNYNEQEIAQISDAIKYHRHKSSDEIGENSLIALISYSDKLSRNCFCCEAYNECNWKSDKKNNTLYY